MFQVVTMLLVFFFNFAVQKNELQLLSYSAVCIATWKYA